MVNRLYFDEANGTIYGKVCEFQSYENFCSAVRSDSDSSGFNIKSIEKKLCYVTQKGLNPDTITPVSDCDIETMWYYVATVVPGIDSQLDSAVGADRKVNKNEVRYEF